MNREKVFISVPAEDEALAAEKIAEVFAEGFIPMEPAMACEIRGIRNTEQARRKILSECQSVRMALFGQNRCGRTSVSRRIITFRSIRTRKSSRAQGPYSCMIIMHPTII